MMNQKSASRIAPRSLYWPVRRFSPPAGKPAPRRHRRPTARCLRSAIRATSCSAKTFLMLTFPLSTELNQTVTIQPDGYISLQSAGSVYAQGLTAPELAEAVKKAYAGILHDPVINVDVQDFQKPSFTVTGQVGKPGQYELRSDLTVAEALAVAGGMTMQTAKTQVLLFHRTSKDWVEVKKVNLRDILKGKNVNEDAMVKPGDMIFVPEKFIANFRKYVPYSVGGTASSYLQP